MTAIYIWSAALVIAIVVNYALHRSLQKKRGDASHARPSRRNFVLLTGGTTLLIGGVLTVLAPARQQSDNEKAAAHLIHIIRTDKIVRLDHLQHSGMERGELDEKVDWTKRNANPTMPEADVEAAERIVKAITEGDLKGLQAIVASYKFKPYARAQIAEALSYTFYLAQVEYRFSFHDRWLYLQPDGLADGQYSIVLSALNEEPSVLRMKENSEHPGQFSSSEAEALDAQKVLESFQKNIVRQALANKASGSKPR